MSRSSTLRRACAALVAVVALVAAGGGAHASAPRSRAVVVVDFGDGVAHVTPITFAGTTTGFGALTLAGYAPSVRSYGGQGGAVCALRAPNGTHYGCPTDSTCLTCQAPAYWSYFRAPPGATAYSYSIVGAGATTVVDGGVEAWKWSAGTPPRFVSFASAFPPRSSTTVTVATTPTTPPTIVVPTTRTVPRTSATQPVPASVAPGVATTVPPTSSSGSLASTTTRAATTTLVSSAPGAAKPPEGRAIGTRAPAVHDGNGALGPFVVFLVVVAALTGAIAVRRTRARRADG